MFGFIKNLAKAYEKPQAKVLAYKEPHIENWNIISCHVNSAPVCKNTESEACRKCAQCKTAKDCTTEVFKNCETRYFFDPETESFPPRNDCYNFETIFMTPNGNVKCKFKDSGFIESDGWEPCINFSMDSLKETPPYSRSLAFIDGSKLVFGTDYKRYRYVFNVCLVANWDELALSVFIGKVDFRFQFENNIPVPTVNYENFRLKLCSNSSVNLRNMSSYNMNAPCYRLPCDSIPELGIPEIAMNKINEILKAFIVKKFGKDTCPDFTAKTLDQAFALAYFPTEPRLFYLMNGRGNPNYSDKVAAVFKDIDVSCRDDRSDLSIFYKHFGKIPDSIKKMYRSRPEYLAKYLCLHKAGITDVNIIRKLIAAQEQRFCGNTASQLELYSDIGAITQVLLHDFGCTQKKIIRILFGDKSCGFIHEWKDCIDMFLIGLKRQQSVKYKYRWQRVTENNCFATDSDFAKRFLTDGVCRSTHDFLASELDKLEKENVPFKLTERQKKRYEHNIDGFNFKLAEDCYRLVDIGSYMSICVGSYDGHVLGGKCLIVYVEKDGSYQACIEVREQENAVHQARAKRNAALTGEADAAFKKWLAITGLQFNGNSY